MVRRRAKRRTRGASYEEVKAKIDAKEGIRLAPVLQDLIGNEDPDDLMIKVTDALEAENPRGVQAGKYYTFIYYAKTPLIQYDQHPLVAVFDVFDWGFRGLNYHWSETKSYTWDEVMSGLYNIKPIELRAARTIPYQKIITK
jgi:hypothetical protein|tara:strand:- start:1597 stop:2022 length:426 start_codon:yes stop_codon:yes gene_type:complete